LAQFNADILLRLLTSPAEKSIKKVEDRLNGLKKVAETGFDIAGGVASSNIKAYGRELGRLDKALNSVGSRLVNVARAFDFGGKTVVGIAGLNALGNTLGALPGKLGGAAGALRDFGGTLGTITAPIDRVTDAIQAMGVQGIATAGGIAAATAALMAFAPTATKAVKQAVKLKEALKPEVFEFPEFLTKNVLESNLAAARKETDKLKAGTSEFRKSLEDVVALEIELNKELSLTARIYENITASQKAQADYIKSNIRASKASRDASGFGEFSQSAGAQTAIDKSIRRQREKIAKAFRDVPAMQAPLMLPSSEMLQASERESSGSVRTTGT